MCRGSGGRWGCRGWRTSIPISCRRGCCGACGSTSTRRGRWSGPVADPVQVERRGAGGAPAGAGRADVQRAGLCAPAGHGRGPERVDDGVREGHAGVPAVREGLSRAGAAGYVARPSTPAPGSSRCTSRSASSTRRPAPREVWGLLTEAGVPVVVHAGHGPVGTDHTGPGPFGAVLAQLSGAGRGHRALGAPDYQAYLRPAEGYERARWTPRWSAPPSSTSSPRSRPRRCRWP